MEEDGKQVYRVEFRVSVLAGTPEEAIALGREKVARDGELTGIWDENFDEV